MTGLILAALFSITQTPSAIPPKALDATATGQTVTKNPKNDKAPSTQPPTSIGPSAADQQHGLVTAAEDNAKAASAAAEAASKNADFSKLNAEATSQNAIAAKASADAAIASERAWVMVGLDKVPGVGFLSYGPGSDAKGTHHEAGVRISCICSNQGKTPAKILEKRAALIFVTPDNPLPLIPNLDIEIEDPIPHYLQPGGEPHKRDWRLDAQYSISGDGGDMATFFVVYGVVKYRHLFSEQVVHTTFGYRIRVDSVLERLIDYPKYNENT